MTKIDKQQVHNTITHVESLRQQIKTLNSVESSLKAEIQYTTEEVRRLKFRIKDYLRFSLEEFGLSVKALYKVIKARRDDKSTPIIELYIEALKLKQGELFEVVEPRQLDLFR